MKSWFLGVAGAVIGGLLVTGLAWWIPVFFGWVTRPAIPQGAVVAFEISNEDAQNGNNCPPGWKPYGDARGRMIMGAGDHQGINKDMNGMALEKYELRETGGEEKHALKPLENARHRHLTVPALPTNQAEVFGGIDRKSNSRMAGAGGGNRVPYTDYSGEGEPHNNLPPYIALNYCEKE